MLVYNSRSARWLILALSTAGVLWLWQQQKAPPKEVGTKAPGVDYSLFGAKLRQFSADGSPQYVISADKIEHKPIDSVYELQKMNVDWLPTTAQRWVVDAQRGDMDDGRNKLQLYDGIVARHQAESGAVTITTGALTILPNEQKAHTESHVEINSELGRVTAAGATIDLEKSIVELRNGVRGLYAPGG